MKPSREELQARVEFLAKKKRSTKRKAPVAFEDSPAARGKVLKLGESSSPSSVREHGPPGQFRVRGCLQHPAVEVPKTTGPQLHSVLRDSDLKRADAMPIEEVLALSLQGAATISLGTFICSFHHGSELFLILSCFCRWPPI